MLRAAALQGREFIPVPDAVVIAGDSKASSGGGAKLGAALLVLVF